MGTSDGNEPSLIRDLTGLQDRASLSAFMEIAFDAVVAFDAQEHVTSWNPAAEKIFGWTAQEALGKTPAELFWPVDVPLANQDRKQRQARLKGGETLQGELTLCRKDSSSFPAQYTAHAIFDSHGKIGGYLAVYRDLSDKVRAREKEEQLQQSNQRLNQILASIKDDFYVLNRNWIFAFASRTFTTRIGKEPEDFVGNNIWEMFPKHVGTILEENFRAAMEKGEVRRFEIPGKYTSAWYRMNVFPSEEGITVIGTDITELKKAEDSLRMSEQRLQRVLETEAVGVLFFDAEGTVIQANDVFLKMTGYRREQVERRELDWRNMTPPEWIEESEAQMAQFAHTGRIGPYEKEYFLADGSRRWMLIAGRAVGDGTTSEFCIDISDRKRTEAALQQSQRTFQELIERAPFGVYVVDSQFRVAHMNASSQTGAFRNVRPVIGRDFTEVMRVLWPEEIASGIVSAFRNTLDTGEPYYSPRFTNPRHDVAAVESYEWELQRMTLPDGQYGVICYYYDSTKLRDAEAATRQSDERYRQIIKSTHEGIWILDLDSVTTYVNDQMAAMLGYRPEEMIGRSAFDFVISDEIDRGRQEWRERRNESTARQSVFGYRHKDGHPVWFLVNSSPMLDDQGRNLGILGMFSDITERRRAEEALLENEKQLQQLNESLEQKVEEKTAEARHLATDLVIAVQRERNRISHILHDDLQQRIYAIQMQLAFLRYELKQESEAARNELTEIEKELLEMLEIARHLSIDLSPPILQNEGLSQAISWLAGQMRKRYGMSIELQAEGPFTLPEEELHVLLFNCVRELLFNVVKHSGTNQAVVKLDWVEGGLRIEVCDAGQGFQASQAGEQAAPETNEDSLPQSFGLPTIRKQLSLFSGQMEIHSGPGAGTQIILFIPVSHEDA
ncbi:MAG: PAS domain S-box protein [Bacteroidota bacterium]